MTSTSFWTISHKFSSPMPPHMRRVLCPTFPTCPTCPTWQPHVTPYALCAVLYLVPIAHPMLIRAVTVSCNPMLCPCCARVPHIYRQGGVSSGNWISLDEFFNSVVLAVTQEKNYKARRSDVGAAIAKF